MQCLAAALRNPESIATDCRRALVHREFSSKDLRSVGNYTLGRLIGKGSFGKVYLASHKLTNGSKVRTISTRSCCQPSWIGQDSRSSQVVLKSSSKEDTNLPREIHHHRQFVHPHIARLYEVIVTEKLVWLVLEYCPGMGHKTADAERGTPRWTG